jgi:hypothetical protein
MAALEAAKSGILAGILCNSAMLQRTQVLTIAAAASPG